MKINNRLESIDALRGLMMILMALDHVRDYFGNFTFDYASGELKTNGMIFFTRWITNLCAPTFVFLVGVSIYLALKSGKTKKELSIFLFTRGLWLIITDFFIMHFAWTFTFDFSLVEFDVLTVTGAGMIVLSLFLFLPRAAIFCLCAGILVSHNLLDGHDIEWLGKFSCLHSPSPFFVNIFHQKINIYPWYVVIPWIAIPGLGYLFGTIFSLPSAKKSNWIIILGTVCLITFFTIRSINIYGDPEPWISHSHKIITLFSFLNVTKYPPSLLYFLITIGLSFWILFLFDKFNNKLTKILSIYGRTPFAFYVLHIFVIHFIALILAYINFGQEAMQLFINNKFLSFDPALWDSTQYGYSLFTNYIIWGFIILLFYPFCKWYGNFKQKHRKIILLSYL